MDKALLCLTHINSFILHSSVRYYYYIHITDEENKAQKGQKLKPQVKSREFWLESLLLNITKLQVYKAALLCTITLCPMED